jgi:hypothetical protein
MLLNEPFEDNRETIVVYNMDRKKLGNVADDDLHLFQGRPVSYGVFVWAGRFTSRRGGLKGPMRMVVSIDATNLTSVGGCCVSSCHVVSCMHVAMNLRLQQVSDESSAC